MEKEQKLFREVPVTRGKGRRISQGRRPDK